MEGHEEPEILESTPLISTHIPHTVPVWRPWEMWGSVTILFGSPYCFLQDFYLFFFVRLLSLGISTCVSFSASSSTDVIILHYHNLLWCLTVNGHIRLLVTYLANFQKQPSYHKITSWNLLSLVRTSKFTSSSSHISAVVVYLVSWIS